MEQPRRPTGVIQQAQGPANPPSGGIQRAKGPAKPQQALGPAKPTTDEGVPGYSDVAWLLKPVGPPISPIKETGSIPLGSERLLRKEELQKRAAKRPSTGNRCERIRQRLNALFGSDSPPRVVVEEPAWCLVPLDVSRTYRGLTVTAKHDPRCKLPRISEARS